MIISDNYGWDESKVVRLQMTDYSIWDELITTVETRGKQSDYRWLTTPAPEMTWLYDEMSPTTGDVHKAGKPTFHLKRKINFLAFSSCQVVSSSHDWSLIIAKSPDALLKVFFLVGWCLWPREAILVKMWLINENFRTGAGLDPTAFGWCFSLFLRNFSIENVQR